MGVRALRTIREDDSMATWTGRKPLDRVGAASVQPGESFEPTEAERQAFADCISDDPVPAVPRQPQVQE